MQKTLERPSYVEPTVRLGRPEDLDKIMELAMMGTEENAFLPPSNLKLVKAIYPALVRDHGLVGVITSDPSRIEGVVILHIGEMWYSDVEVLEEKAIFIHPEYRNARGGRASKLIEFSKKVSDELDKPLLIGVLSNHRTQGKVKMYSRHLGEPAGAFFLYHARTGGWKDAGGNAVAEPVFG